MSSTPNDFKRSALALANGVDEIDRRNSVSRAYYAAFHVARVVADQIGIVDRNSNLRLGDHERLIKRYEQADQQPYGKKIAYVLADMRRRRVVSDYELGADVPNAQSTLQLQMLTKFETSVLEPLQAQPKSGP